MAASFQPADKLWSRTFLGLLGAQFLAAFNDQAINASAMFFAIKTGAMGEKEAITWLMFLYYAPWAVFCTIAGWLADRYSKRDALVLWKVIEVGVALVALAGFWMGQPGGAWAAAGPWVVTAAVFGMGLHSAFFVPAKYGAMPEILQPQMLSRGNGILESLSFLAIILGTVCGGALSYYCDGREYIIGLVLVGLAVVGLLTSLLIQRMPAANPGRPFPPYVYKPLLGNIRQMLGSRPMVLAVIGIAFFTFIVAFMRSTVYMYGESQAPRWNDLDVSLVVGMVAVGIGVGAPLVGYLSGGKVEVGLVPIGSLGMAVVAAAAAFSLQYVPGLIACIIVIGLLTGFYLVPLYALLQHRAPKTSKGDWVATSNFLNVTGAMVALGVFYVMSQGAILSGLAPPLQTQDGPKAKLGEVHGERDRPDWMQVGDQRLTAGPTVVIDPVRRSLKNGAEVKVASYELAGVTHYHVHPSDEPQKPVYDQRRVPSLLFVSVAVMTLLTYFALRSQLPDLFLRTLLWLRRVRRYGLEVSGADHLPTSGPVILATNAADLDACLSVLSATDRTTRFILLRTAGDAPLSRLTRLLARRDSLTSAGPGESPDWNDVMRRAGEALGRKEVVGVPLDGPYPPGWLERLLENIGPDRSAVVLPVRVDRWEKEPAKGRRIYLLAGEPLKPGATVGETRRAVEQLAGSLEDWEKHKKGTEVMAGMH
ncbi:MAG TPA: MFS transporter [Gemmataceae bacterium]|nr:MFS transporter [Gemmataceae bacterium]